MIFNFTIIFKYTIIRLLYKYWIIQKTHFELALELHVGDDKFEFLHILHIYFTYV